MVKVGLIAEFTATVMLIVLAHCPASGVKVAVTLLPPDGSMLAGAHEPVIPLLEVVGKETGASFSQSGPGLVKEGAVAAFTLTVIITALAHCPASGVKVAVTSLPLDGSILAGDHEPVIPLLEVVGKETGASF